MKLAKIKLTGAAPIMFSRFHNTDKLPKEAYDEYEKRTWIEKCHFDSDDNVVITPFMIKNMLSDAAKFLSIKIKGKGQATYTKHFEAGIIVQDNFPIGIKRKDVKPTSIHVPSDGKRGGSSRVLKYFPCIEDWSCEAVIYIADDTITREVLFEHISQAGTFIGIGALRPRNNGIAGRFKAEILSFDEASWG